MCCKISTVFGFLFGCLGAAGQSSSDIATFGAIRTAVRDTIQGNRNFQLFRDKQYDLFLCSYPGRLGMSDSPLEPAAMVAIHIETYRAELTRLRVPESVWSRNLAALDQFGARSVRWNGAHDNRFDDMMRQVEKGLADSVIAYGRSAPGGPQFMWEGGCGAGEAEVTISSEGLSRSVTVGRRGWRSGAFYHRVPGCDSAVAKRRCLRDGRRGTDHSNLRVPVFWLRSQRTPESPDDLGAGGWRGDRIGILGPVPPFHVPNPDYQSSRGERIFLHTGGAGGLPGRLPIAGQGSTCIGPI